MSKYKLPILMVGVDTSKASRGLMRLLRYCAFAGVVYGVDGEVL